MNKVFIMNDEDALKFLIYIGNWIKMANKSYDSFKIIYNGEHLYLKEFENEIKIGDTFFYYETENHYYNPQGKDGCINLHILKKNIFE